MLLNILHSTTRVVMLGRDLCNWLVASNTSQCIATHGADTRQCRRFITHSWIVGHISCNTRCFSYGAAQVFPFGAIRVKLLDCVAGPADIEEFGCCTVFLWVKHVGTVSESGSSNYACKSASPFGTESEENLAAGFLLDNVAGSR